MHSNIILIIFAIQMLACLAKPVEHTIEFVDDKFNGNSEPVIFNEYSKECEEIMGAGGGMTAKHSLMETAIMSFLLNGHMHPVDVLLNKLVEHKCYPDSMILKFRRELDDVHEFLALTKESSEVSVDNFDSHRQAKRIQAPEYFKELNDMVTSFIDASESGDPNSLELLKYMSEHVVQLERDGDLSKHQAEKLLVRIDNKLLELENNMNLQE